MSRRLSLTVAAGTPIRRGNDHYWMTIRELDLAGPWTIRDILRRSTAADRWTVGDFVRRLHAAGIARRLEEARTEGSRTHALWRLERRPADTPRLRRDGSPARQVDGQVRMWNAMRALHSFTAKEIAVAASVDDGIVEISSAKAYIKRLAGVGYLTVVVPGAPARLATWRLKPSMNTGPKSPLILQTKIVWDQNRAEVIGPVVAEEVKP